MRSLLFSLLSLATVTSILAADAAPAKKDVDDLDEVVPDTIFNGQTVPPMKDLDEQHIVEDISKGNWYISSSNTVHGNLC